MIRMATAVWQGDLKTGKGMLSATSGVLSNTPYTFATRFENAPGTNPEELIAAAHAGCFSMAFSAELGRAGLTPERVETTAEVTLDTVEGKPTVTKSHLRMKARVPGATPEQFETIANDAKAGCPISRLLRAEITLDAVLEG
jgi:osmotically inducible protein OsmC